MVDASQAGRKRKQNYTRGDERKENFLFKKKRIQKERDKKGIVSRRLARHDELTTMGPRRRLFSFSFRRVSFRFFSMYGRPTLQRRVVCINAYILPHFLHFLSLYFPE